jgi:hypothetical protein
MGVIGEFDAPGYHGTSITPHLNLYNSIPSGKDGGYVVPLGVLANPPFENGQDFSNSMFGPNIRSASQISATPSLARAAMSCPQTSPAGSWLGL